MTKEEWDALVEAFQHPPYSSYRGWTFEYEHPGFFMYYHDSIPFSVYFTPEWNEDHEIALQIHDEEGNSIESESLPFFTNTPEDLYAIVRQWLDFTEWNAQGRRQSIKDWSPTVKATGWTPRHDLPF